MSPMRAPACALLPLAPLVLLACASCASRSGGGPPPAPPPAAGVGPGPVSANEKFEKLAARFLAEYLRRDPTASTEIGDHSHDGQWPDPSAEGEAETRAFVSGLRAELGAIRSAARPGELSDRNRVDAEILATQLDSCSSTWTNSRTPSATRSSTPTCWATGSICC